MWAGTRQDRMSELHKSRTPEFLAADAIPMGSYAGGGPAFRLNWKRALQMHPRAAGLTAALVFTAVFGFGLIMPRQYEAKAVFSVSPTVTTLVPQNGIPGTMDVSQFDSSMQQDVETLQREDTVAAAIQTLPRGAWRKPNESLAAATSRMEHALGVARVGTSLQIAATLNGPSPKDAAQALAAVSAQFLKTVHREEDGRATERVQLLKEEAARLDSNLQQDRDAAAELAGELGVSRLRENERTPADVNADQLRSQLAELQRARAFAQAGINTPQGGGIDEASSGGSSVAGLMSTLNIRKAALQSQMAGMTARNPIYQQDVAEVRAIDGELASALRRSDAEQLRRQQEMRNRSVSGVTQEEQRLEHQLVQDTSGMPGIAAKLEHYSELSHEIERLQTRLGTVRDAISSTLLQSSAPSRVNMVVAPTDSDLQAGGKGRLALLAALPLALLAGLAAAILAYRRDERVFLAVDLEAVLGIRPMAVLPAESEVSDAIADQGLLRMAASIESAYLKSRSKTFVFTATSADSDVEELVFRVQGKLRDLGYSALWLGAETLLRAEKDFEQMYGRGPSSAMGLRFSDAPAADGSTAEGVAIQRLNWLKRDYDMVLIDAPPLLQSALAEYAARRTDGTILVSESGVTTREELAQAGGLLEQLGAQGVGAVLQELQVRYAAPGYKKALAKAEERAARQVNRKPVDNAGAWQVLNAGTMDELRVPGDPLARSMSRVRPARVRTRSAGLHVPEDEPKVEDWDESSARLVDEAAYSYNKE